MAEFLQKTSKGLLPPDRDGDGAYDTGLNCKWLIVAPEPFFVGIHFDTSYVAFDIEESPVGDCTYDSLTVRF